MAVSLYPKYPEDSAARGMKNYRGTQAEWEDWVIMGRASLKRDKYGLVSRKDIVRYWLKPSMLTRIWRRLWRCR